MISVQISKIQVQAHHISAFFTNTAVLHLSKMYDLRQESVNILKYNSFNFQRFYFQRFYFQRFHALFSGLKCTFDNCAVTVRLISYW